MTTTTTGVHMIGAGDIAGCTVSTDSITAVQVLNYLALNPGTTVYALGDNVYEDGTAAEYTNCYQPTWGQFLTSTRPTIGNHEYNLGNATPTFDYFGSLVGPRDLGYYSYDVGAWHVVVLNSNTSYVPISAGSVQETWLKNDLAANTKRCILAYWHHPRFYSTTVAPYGMSNRMLAAWNDLYAAGATLILDGHIHQYERFAPQDPNGNATSRGIRQFIVGTGGRSVGSQPTVIAPNSEVQKGNTFGVMELILGDSTYSWNFMAIPGDAFTDAGTGTCVDTSVNHPPIAKPGGPYTGSPGTAVAFDGSASIDPDGDLPLTYAWDFGDGSTGSSAKPTHTYATVGTYTVTLVVTDSKGLSGAPATTSASISGANQAPTANAGGPYTGVEGSAVTFNGSGSSDPDPGDTLTYAWNFGDGSTGTGVSPTHTYVDNGTYTVTLTVTDSHGAPSTAATSTATIANAAPVVNTGSNGTARVGKSYSLKWSFTDAGTADAPWSYSIDWGDGSLPTAGTASTQGATINSTHVWRVAGSYTVSVTVTDKDGGTGSGVRSITAK